MSVVCPYCDQAAALVTGADVYPHRPDLSGLKFYRCDPCDAHVGCHRPGTWAWVGGAKVANTGTEPLGRLANAELRAAKKMAHDAFDPVWRDGGISRRDAYAWLAGMLGIELQQCHIGLFDTDQCAAVARAVHALKAVCGRKGKQE